MKDNPYEVLGVSVAATQHQIRAAYRKRAAQNHPDRGGDRAVFASVRESYELLMDDARRKIWDDDHAAERISKRERQQVCREMVMAWLYEGEVS